jgi:hypothetical protein
VKVDDWLAGVCRLAPTENKQTELLGSVASWCKAHICDLWRDDNSFCVMVSVQSPHSTIP